MAVSTAAENDSQNSGIKNLPARIKGFYADVRAETKKVTVPSWKEVRGTTVVVLITVAIFGAFFWVVDMFLTKLVNLIILHFSH